VLYDQPGTTLLRAAYENNTLTPNTGYQRTILVLRHKKKHKRKNLKENHENLTKRGGSEKEVLRMMYIYKFP
jgi:hypothetical protein